MRDVRADGREPRVDQPIIASLSASRRWRCRFSRLPPSVPRARSRRMSASVAAFAQAALTSGVQAGFVLGLPRERDARARRSHRSAPALRRVASSVAAVANALLLVVDPASRVGARCCVSSPASCMAGVYPVGMKLASTWAKGDMGLMVGILVGALTLGSASPHLFNAFGGIDWRDPAGRLVIGDRARRRDPDRLRRHRARTARRRRASTRARR